METNSDFISRLDAVGFPSDADVLAHAAQFERPRHHLAVRIRGDDVKPSVGVDPLELLNRPDHAGSLVVIEHGKGVMGERRNGESHGDEQRKDVPQSSMNMHPARQVIVQRLNPNPSTLTHFGRVGNEIGNDKAA